MTDEAKIQELVLAAMNGDEAADTELDRLVEAGNLTAIHGTLHGLRAAWIAGDYNDLDYTSHALAYAYLAEQAGDPDAPRMRAALTHERALAHRRLGDPYGAEQLNGQALHMLEPLADAGDPEALALIEFVAGAMRPGAIKAVDAGRRAAAREAAKAPAMVWANVEAEPLPLSRWSRFRLWMGDRCRGFGWWVSDRFSDLAHLIDRGVFSDGIP